MPFIHSYHWPNLVRVCSEPEDPRMARVVDVSDSHRFMLLRLSGGRLVLCSADGLPSLPPATPIGIDLQERFEHGEVTLELQSGERFIARVMNADCDEEAAARALDD